MLRVNTDQLTLHRSDADPPAPDINEPVFHSLADRLATAMGIDAELASARLRTAAVAAVHRGDQPHDEKLLATLEAYVRAMEQRHGP